MASTQNGYVVYAYGRGFVKVATDGSIWFKKDKRDSAVLSTEDEAKALVSRIQSAYGIPDGMIGHHQSGVALKAFREAGK